MLPQQAARAVDTSGVTSRRAATGLVVVVLALAAAPPTRTPARRTVRPEQCVPGPRGRYGGPAGPDRGDHVADGVGARAGGGREHRHHQRHLVPDRRGVRRRLPAGRPGPGLRHRRGRHPDHQRAARHRWAVVVRQDQGREEAGQRRGHRPREGEQFTIDKDSDVPTITGGTWALGGDTLAYATLGPDGGYCVATVDLATRETSIALVRRGQARLQRRARHRCRHRAARLRRREAVVPHRRHRRGRASSTPSQASPSARPGRARCSATTRRSGR